MSKGSSQPMDPIAPDEAACIDDDGRDHADQDGESSSAAGNSSALRTLLTEQNRFDRFVNPLGNLGAGRFSAMAALGRSSVFDRYGLGLSTLSRSLAAANQYASPSRQAASAQG